MLDFVRRALCPSFRWPQEAQLVQVLDVVRRCLVFTLAWVSCTAMYAYYRSDDLMLWLQKPLPPNLRLTMIHPTDALSARIEAAVIAGSILASPVVFAQVLRLIKPRAIVSMRGGVLLLGTLASALFLCGAWLGYSVLLPRSLVFLINDLGGNLNHRITICDYMAFFSSGVLGLGLLFELPVLMALLAAVGFVETRIFVRHARIALLASVFLAVVMCPDPSFLGVAIFASPICLLYAVGIVLSLVVQGRLQFIPTEANNRTQTQVGEV